MWDTQDDRLHSNKEAGSKVRQVKPAETPWTVPPSLLQHQDKTYIHTRRERETVKGSSYV